MDVECMVRRRYQITGGSEVKFIFLPKDLAYVGNKIDLGDDSADTSITLRENLWTVEIVCS